jgi:hypothetical protein
MVLNIQLLLTKGATDSLINEHLTLTEWRVAAEQDEQDHVNTPHVDGRAFLCQPITHTSGATHNMMLDITLLLTKGTLIA